MESAEQNKRLTEVGRSTYSPIAAELVEIDEGQPARALAESTP